MQQEDDAAPVLTSVLEPARNGEASGEGDESVAGAASVVYAPGTTAVELIREAADSEFSRAGGNSICLTAICKNEAETIGGMIESARPLIDRWAIVDTGSTDGTQDVVREALSGLPGALYESDWLGFGPNRTEALARGKESGADYLLMLDADHRLHVEDTLERLDKDSYLVRVRGNMGWKLPLLVRAQHPWEYRGSAHCYLTSGATPATVGDLGDVLSIDGGPSPTREKIEGDLPLLQREVAEEPGNRRAVFYLAQTYRDLDRHAEAAATYLRRARMGGWEQEIFWSLYQRGLIISWREWEKAVPILLQAWGYRPTRAEPLYILARGYQARGDHFLGRHFAEIGSKIPLPSDNLFVLNWVYEPDEWQKFFPEPVAA